MSGEKHFSTGGVEEEGSKPSTRNTPSLKFLKLMLTYLARLYNNKGRPITYAEFQAECKACGIKGGRQLDVIKASIDLLIKEGFPIVETDDKEVHWNYLKASQFLDRTKVLDSLQADADSKAHLARKVVEILKETGSNHRNVFMGIGTTVYAVFREILRQRDLGNMKHLDTVYTDNLLIVFEHMHKDPTFNLEVLNGRLYRDWARMDFDQIHLGHPANLSIVSFKGYNKTYGFSSDAPIDKKNKKMSIKPHDDCKLVIIPMSLNKFGVSVDEGDSVIEITDFWGDIKYIFVTDEPVSPDDDLNKEHVDHLFKHERKKGLNIEIQYVPKEVSSKEKMSARAEIRNIPPKRSKQSSKVRSANS